MKLTKLQLEELYKENILKTDKKSLDVLTMGQVIDKLEYGQIAVQYVENLSEFQKFLYDSNRFVADYIYYNEKTFRLNGYCIEEKFGDIVTPLKHPSHPIVKFIILDVVAIINFQ